MALRMAGGGLSGWQGFLQPRGAARPTHLLGLPGHLSKGLKLSEECYASDFPEPIQHVHVEMSSSDFNGKIVGFKLGRAGSTSWTLMYKGPAFTIWYGLLTVLGL